jgi:hypothetical protein
MFIPDPGSWIWEWDVYPGSGMLSRIRNVYPGSGIVYPGSTTLILAVKILINAIMKCENLIKNI